MNEIYIVISTGDGARMERLTRAQLIERLEEGYWGTKKFIERAHLERGALDLLGVEGLTIIKGDVVVPRAKEVVKTWTL